MSTSQHNQLFSEEHFNSGSFPIVVVLPLELWGKTEAESGSTKIMRRQVFIFQFGILHFSFGKRCSSNNIMDGGAFSWATPYAYRYCQPTNNNSSTIFIIWMYISRVQRAYNNLYGYLLEFDITYFEISSPDLENAIKASSIFFYFVHYQDLD